jgi:precorrin-6A/cobalt-precorrin-6A reductase
VGTTRVLLLAGTTEAAGFAALLVGRSDVEVVASLAGRTRSPAPMPCRVRSGGLGGVEGLARELGTGGYDVLVDATHPFARAMPHHAAEAAATVGIPRLRLVRPPWRPGPDDDWHAVAGLGAAADALRDLGARRVLLTTGRLELAPFAAVAATRFVVRSIEPPDPMPLVDATVLLARGPFSVDDELALLRGHRIDTIVTRNSGGAATAAKLTAARTLGARVVMVRRPPGPPGPEVATPEAALRWIDALPALPARTSGAAPAGPAQMASEPADGTCTRFDP